jgi:hypothetical protein
MAAQKDTTETTAVDMAQMGIIIGNAVSQAIAAVAPPRELKEGDPEYVARQQAEGWFDTFDVPVFQNAYEAQARGLSPEVRKRASTLKPGKYLKGRVTVEVDTGGVRIKYPVSGDNMMKNMALWRDFPDLVTQIWDEMHAPVPA